MRAFAAVVGVAAMAGPAWAGREVTGTVVDAATGEPVAGAIVLVGEGNAETAADGTFAIAELPFGRLDVLVVADGYGAFFGAARIGAALTIRLGPDSTGEVIEVVGHAPSGPPLHLGADEIRAMPGSGNDALRALQSLPGVARTPFGLGGLSLRGTAPRDTNVYLDGIEVPLLYHFGGLASFLPTGAVDELTLQPGGASTRYGRGLGGVAVISSRTGRRDRWRAGGEVSLIHAAALAEGPGPGGGGWLIGFRRSYFDAIIAAAGIDLSLVPRYMDAQVRWESGDGRWTALAFASDDKLRLIHDPSDGDTGGLDTSNLERFDYTSRFARLGLRYRAVHGATAVTIVPSAGIDDVRGRALHRGLDKGIHRWSVPVALRADVATPFAGGTIAVGLDSQVTRHAYDMLNTPPPTPLDPSPDMPVARALTRWAPDLGLWAEQSWFFDSDRIEVRPGVRTDYLGLPGTWSLDPRLMVGERLPHGIRLEQSLGVYHAPPLVTDFDPIFGDRVMLSSKAYEAALGIKTILGDAHELSATVYYQDLRDLPVDAISAATPLSDNGGSESGGLLAVSRELVDEQFGAYSYREAIGKGRAYGVELIARRSAGRLTGWLAYTFARSLRFNPTRDDGWLPYVLDQPHSFTALASVTVGRWRFGGRIRGVTGTPFTPAIGSTYDPDEDEYIAIDGPLLSERLPTFFQLDLRIDKVWHRPWGGLVLYLDVQNVTNRANAEGITYNEDFSVRSYTRGLPVFPSIGVEYLP